MTWPTWPAGPGPKFNFSFQRQPLVETISFGDGYEQQTVLGINGADEGTVSQTWESLTLAEKTTFENFLTSQAGSPFYYTIPGGFTQYTFACDTWKFDLVEYGVWNLQADFRREFNT